MRYFTILILLLLVLTGCSNTQIQNDEMVFGAEGDITYGTAENWTGTASIDKNGTIIQLDDNKFLYCGAIGGSNEGTCIIGSVSGTDISWGASSTYAASVGISGDIGACKVDTDTFAVIYADNNQGFDGFMRVGSSTGNTINGWGPEYEYLDSDAEWPSCVQLDTNKIAIAYNDETGGDNGMSRICTISDYTLTCGSAVEYLNAGLAKYNNVCNLGNDRFVIAFEDDAVGDDMKVIAASSTGTTINGFGSVNTVHTYSTDFVHCAQLDDDKFVAVWRGYDANLRGRAVACTVDSDEAISCGSDVGIYSQAETDTFYNPYPAKISTTQFIVSGENVDNSEYGENHLFSVSGTTISPVSNAVFHNAQTNYTATAFLSENKFVTCYQDDADANNIGECIVGDIEGAGVIIDDTLGDFIIDGHIIID